MKKTITYLLLMLITAKSFSQTFDKVYKAIPYTYEYGTWVKGEVNYPERMFIIIKGSEVKITNASDTRIITYGYPRKENTNEYTSSTWDAYDSDGRNCTFIMTNYYNASYGMSVFIMYNKYAIQYVTEPK